MMYGSGKAYGGNGFGGGYSAYREIGVKTASQGKLVVMLYDGAVTNLEKAIALVGEDGKIDAKNIESFGSSLQKVMDIITELEVSLDLDKGGEIAKNLMSLYVFFNKQVLAATMSHDKKNLSFVHGLLLQLRDAWTQASETSANTQAKIPGEVSSFSITG